MRGRSSGSITSTGYIVIGPINKYPDGLELDMYLFNRGISYYKYSRFAESIVVDFLSKSNIDLIEDVVISLDIFSRS